MSHASDSTTKRSGVYLITCTANGKIYVGSSVNIKERWRHHKEELRRHAHHNLFLQHAWNKYGEAAFIFEVLEYCDRAVVREREQVYLDRLQSYKRDIGFNFASDARTPAHERIGTKLSPEHCAKISAIHKGKVVSPETRAKLAAAARRRNPETYVKIAEKNRGRKLSEAQRAKLSRALLGNQRAKGLKHTDEVKAKQSERASKYRHTPERKAKIGNAHRGKVTSPETRMKIGAANSKEYIVTTPDGVEMQVRNLGRFCRENGLRVNRVWEVLSGKIAHYKGWKFRRV